MKYIKGLILALLVTSAFSLCRAAASEYVVAYNDIRIPKLGGIYTSSQEEKKMGLPQTMYLQNTRDTIGGNQRGVRSRTYRLIDAEPYSNWATLVKEREVTMTGGYNTEIGLYKVQIQATKTDSLTAIRFWGTWTHS